MSNTNVTQSSNFIFSLTSNKLKQLDFYVTEFTGLGLSFTEVTPNAYMGQIIKRPGDTITFNDITLQVVVDEDYEVLQEIYDSIMSVKNIAENTIDWNQTFGGILYAASNRNNFKKKIEFTNCWIKDVGDLILTTTQTTADPVILTVTLAFDSYEISDA